MNRPLDRYREMRDFGRTPEPAGEPASPPEQLRRFVVQEHHATSLHWDLRLERDGVLASWAVPKGIPPDPRVDHLAVATEDHPLEYLDFHGTIPEGEYGGGRMTVWDRGTYDCEKWSDREVMVVLHGQRVSGRHVLFRTGDRQWMIHRMDPPEDPAREPMPRGLRPVPMSVGPLPGDQAAWSFEAAMGGRRVLASSEGGRVRLGDGDGVEVTARYPELRDLGRAIGAVAVVLEGEIVVTGDDGRPDHDAHLRRDSARGDAAVRRLSARHPAALLLVDTVWLEGHATAPLPYRQRRTLLERLELAGPAWQTAPTHPGEGDALLAAGRAQGLPGVRGRRLDAGYTTEAVRFTPA